MMPLPKTSWAGWVPGVCVGLCVPSLILLLVCIAAAVLDQRMIRMAVVQHQAELARSECLQRAAVLEAQLDSQQEKPRTWEQLRDNAAFSSFWSSFRRPARPQGYLAIVNDDGTIVMHNDSRQIGQRLEQGWNNRRLPDVGDDVVRAEPGSLAPNAPTMDVSVPFAIPHSVRGTLHAGVDEKWLNAEVATRQQQGLRHWKWLTGLALASLALSVIGAVYLLRHQQGLTASLTQQTQARIAELSNLGGGLAHEVRNPLHALRINLHILRRAMDGRASLPEDQLLATLRESGTAIDRIEAVLRDLLLFVEPTAGKVVEVDLAAEIRAVLDVLAENLKRDSIAIDSSRCGQSAVVQIDADRIRQMLLNLLTFAQLRVGKQGAIAVEMLVSRANAELAIAHAGPTLTTDQAAHLFEPFRSPVDSGSGLGMALVHVHASAAGGNVRYEQPEKIGNRLVLSLPIGRPVPKERQNELQA